jgi:hypothetical protein
MINSVRNTVLSILNKNNYGYISPSDFNLYAKQAQLEIFDDYFNQYNKTINLENARRSGTGYGNELKAIEEMIDGFSQFDTLAQVAPTTNEYFLPSLTTTGFGFYNIITVTCYDGSGNLLGEAEKVTHNAINMLNSSMLTAPSTMFPAYTQAGDKIIVYPDSINGASSVKATYIRYPKDPKWTYVSIGNGEPVFDQTQLDYQDFELPIEEETNLIIKILQYAGLSIREAQVVTYASTEEVKKQQQ